METLAFIHAAVAHEDPTPDPELTAFENIDLKASRSLAMGLVVAGVVATTLSHTEQAQATIYPGQRGPGVAALQSALGVSSDGVFGPQTLSALKRFQASKGLSVDGIAGRATLPALGLVANLGPGGTSVGEERPSASTSYVTASSGVNVRSSPWGAVRYGLRYGSAVSLLGPRQYYGGRNWAQLSDGNWIATQYIGYSGGSVGEVPQGAGAYAAASSGLLIRSSPAGYVIGSLGYGAPVSLTGPTQYAAGRNWSRLSGGGWVASEYIGYR